MVFDHCYVNTFIGKTKLENVLFCFKSIIGSFMNDVIKFEPPPPKKNVNPSVMHLYQVSANQDRDLRFVDETNSEALYPISNSN